MTAPSPEGLIEVELSIWTPESVDADWWECKWVLRSDSHDLFLERQVRGRDSLHALQLAMKLAAEDIAEFETQRALELTWATDYVDMGHEVGPSSAGKWFGPTEWSYKPIHWEPVAHADVDNEPTKYPRGLTFFAGRYASSNELIAWSDLPATRRDLVHLVLGECPALNDAIWVGLARCERLKHVEVGSCPALHCSGIERICSLHTVELRRVPLASDVLARLTALPSLELLRLREMPLGGAALCELRRSTRLEVLELDGTEFDAVPVLEALGNLKRLRHLTLFVPVGATELLSLVSSSSSLRELWLGKHTPSAVVQACREAAPQLRIRWVGEPV